MQIGEKTAFALLPAPDETKMFNCPWMCSREQSGPHEKKTHYKVPSYPEGGNAERSKGAPDSWRKTHKRVPWLWPEKNDGINSHHQKEDYHIARHSAASSYPFPEYATEGHHLISCDLFDEENFPALVKNALLMGYDVNHKNNGFHVPAFVVDIVCHDLQHHASDHSWSDPAPLEYDLDAKIEPYLRQLEEWCINYCAVDFSGTCESQEKIIKDLNRVSNRVRGRIARWGLYLTKLAKMRLGDLVKYEKSVQKPKGINVKSGDKKTRYEKLADGNALIARELKKASLTAKNLMPSGFPDWDYYIAKGIMALKHGANPIEPFSRWLSRAILEEKNETLQKDLPL